MDCYSKKLDMATNAGIINSSLDVVERAKQEIIREREASMTIRDLANIINERKSLSLTEEEIENESDEIRNLRLQAAEIETKLKAARDKACEERIAKGIPDTEMDPDEWFYTFWHYLQFSNAINVIEQ
jgi:septal ring factor EnvC (AmiA/AmiB activator)